MSTLQDLVQKHIDANTLRINDDITNVPLSCIDGRQGKDFTFGVPGAAMGVFLSLASYLHATVGFEEKNAHDIMLRAFGDDDHISGHTDDHATGELEEIGKCPCAGCGHVKFALTKPELYGLKGIDIASVNHFIVDETEHGAPVKCLSKGHEEQEVLFVHTPHLEKVSIAPSYLDEQGNLINQMFVYHPDIHEFWLKRVFEELKKEYPDKEFGFETFKATAMRQVGATKDILAKDKPVFHLWVDGEKMTLAEN